MKDILPRIILVAREAGSNDQIKLKSIQRELVHKTNELTEALAKERLLKKEITDEKKKFSAQIRTLREKYELEKDALIEKSKGENAVLETQLQERKTEIDSLKERNKKLEDRLDRVFDQGYDERKWLDKEREWLAKEKLQEQLTQARHETELAKRSEQANVKSNVDEAEYARLKGIFFSKSEVTTLQGRRVIVRASANYERSIKGERASWGMRHHWATSKAKLAQCERKMEHENYVVHVLEPIVIILRDQMSKSNLGKARKLLDTIQDNRLMELQ